MDMSKAVCTQGRGARTGGHKRARAGWHKEEGAKGTRAVCGYVQGCPDLSKAF